MTKERVDFEIHCMTTPEGNNQVVFNFNDRDLDITFASMNDKDVFETFNFIVDELKIKLKKELKK